MNYLTHNDLLWDSLMYGGYQSWVHGMALDGDFDWADGPLDSPVGRIMV